MDTTMSTVGQEVQCVVDALTNLAQHEDIETGRLDFADLVARVVACTAANLGSVDSLLAAAKPGAHTDHLTALIDAVVIRDWLLTQRTRDVQLHVDLDAEFAAVGITGRYQSAADAIRHDLERETDVFAVYELREELAAVTELFEADQAGYLAAYSSAARAYLSAQGLPEDVEIEIASRPTDDDAAPVWDDAASTAHAAARTASAGYLEHFAQGPGYRSQARRILAGRTRTEGVA